jgi:hypothetical protein
MALFAAAKFKYGASMSSPCFYITTRSLLHIFFDIDQRLYVVIK